MALLIAVKGFLVICMRLEIDFEWILRIFSCFSFVVIVDGAAFVGCLSFISPSLNFHQFTKNMIA